MSRIGLRCRLDYVCNQEPPPPQQKRYSTGNCCPCIIGFRGQGFGWFMKGFALWGSELRVCVLGGSWVVISGVLSPLIWVVIIATLLITPPYSHP